MNIIQNSLAILLFSFSLPTIAQQIVKSQVKEALIFAHQAQLTREVKVKLHAGENTLIFAGLESNIVPNSFLLNGTHGITILSNNLQQEKAHKSDQTKEVQEILNQLNEIKRKEHLSIKKTANYHAEKNVILHNKSVAENGVFQLEKMKQLTAYYRESLNKLDALIYDEERETEEIRRAKEALNESLKEAGYKAYANALRVHVIAEKEVSASIKITYLANQIGWIPFYEVKSDGMAKTIEMICKATIHQNSQVDWKDVKITLSTNTPLNNETIPVIHPWRLAFRQQLSQAKRMDQGAIPQRNTAYTMGAEAVPEADYDSRSMADFTTALDNLISREFLISLPYSISGTNGKTVVEIDQFKVNADYTYYAAPKYNNNVFLLANLTDWQQHSLLPGTAHLFLENRFVGTTFIDPNETNDTLKLVLGKDDNIIIKRERIKDLTKNSFIGSNKRIEMGVQLTIKNNKPNDIKLILEDQVPITSDDRIEITINDISTAKHNKTTGKLTWDLELKAGQSKSLVIKYEVKHPKNQQLHNF